MAHRKNGLEKQQQILNQFERVIRHDSQRTEPTLIETLLLQSEKKRIEWEKRRPQPAPRISFWNPNNPLNGFDFKTPDEKKAILASIKQREKTQVG
jgi:hypothetical protein